MMQALERGKIRRVVICLNATHEGRATLELGGDLALALQAEIAALFVEDTDLFNLASLPFSREVLPAGGRSRNLDPMELGRAVAASKAQYRRLVEQTAERMRLACAFESRRGSGLDDLSAYCTPDDLLVIGGWGRPFAPRLLIGPELDLAAIPANAIAFASGAAPRALGAPVLAIGLKGPVRDDLLRLTAGLARQFAAPLRVMWLGDEGGAPASLPSDLPDDVKVQYEQISDPDAEALQRRLRSLAPRLIVVDVGGEVAPGHDEALKLINRIDCPHLFIKQ